MFGSISIAPPNSIVTSSFTATGTCQVGILEAVAVRVNGQLTASRDIILNNGDKIELDVMSGDINDHKFIHWTFNGNDSYFAVASSSGETRPQLRTIYRNVLWRDFAPKPTSHKLSREDVNGIEEVLTDSFGEGDPPNSDLVVVLDPTSNYSYFASATYGSSYRRRVQHASKAISYTRVWDSGLQQWHSYFLLDTGFVEKVAADWTITRTPVAAVEANCIFTDGMAIYVGGKFRVQTCNDMTTFVTVASSADSIVYGAGLGETILLVTDTGRVLKMGPTSNTELFKTKMVSGITTYKNNFLVSMTEDYKVRVLDSTGNFVKDIGTGEQLPYGVGAARDKFAISFADSKDVWTLTDINATPVVHTFNTNVTYAMPVGASLIASHYLADFKLTIPPNPPVTGINWPIWKAPLNAYTGSGEAQITTLGEDLKVTGAPNCVAHVNNSKLVHKINSGNVVSVATVSKLGRVATSVAIGNYAFDFKVDAAESTAFTTMPAGSYYQSYSNSPRYIFTLPEKAVDVQVALTNGVMRVNNAPYNGRTPLTAGDIIQVDITGTPGRDRVFSTLTIADSQFTLTSATLVNTILVNQRFVAYGDDEVVSTVTAQETGEYSMPLYTGVSVKKDGVELTFPTVLQKDDVLEVNHNRASQWWLDSRDTILLGPSINHIIRNTTTVDDQPDYVDFGMVHMGIPDFEFEGEFEPSISGLSDGYAVQIYNEYMRFSVNGAPWEEKPMVQNGDKVRVLYRVKNLFETMWAKTDLADGSGPYEWGELNIDPALGEWMPPRDSIKTMATLWKYVTGRYEEREAALALKVSKSLEQTNAPSAVLSTTPVRLSAPMIASGNVAAQRYAAGALSLYLAAGNQHYFSSSVGSPSRSSYALASSSVPQDSRVQIRWTQSSEPDEVTTTIMNAVKSAPLYNDNSVSTHTVALRQELEASFARPASYTKFSPNFQHEATLVPPTVPQFYAWRQVGSDRHASTGWERQVVAPLLHSPVMPFDQQVYAHRRADTAWIRQEAYRPNWVTVVGQRYVPYTFLTHYPNQFKIEPSLIMTEISPKVFSQQTMLWPNLDPLFSRDSFVTKIIEPKFNQGNFVTKVIEPKFSRDSLVPCAKFEGIMYPQFVMHFKNIAPADVKYETVAAVNLDPRKLRLDTFGEVQQAVFFDSEKAVSNNKNMGAYETEAEANAAALAYNNVLPVAVYRQPEGTFSYTFQRDTGLVCQIKGTNIYAVKWLIGGG